MKIFGRKAATDANRRERAAKQKQGQPSASHRVTLDLYRAEVLAAMMAKSRSSDCVEVTDLLAGMYISNWERLSRYWADSKQEEIETLLQRICRISPQRWHSWIESYQATRDDGRKRVWQRLRMSKNGKAGDKSPGPSADMVSVLKRAEELTPFREKSGGASTPILTTECVLLCILRTFGSEISRRLLATGIDQIKLERDVLLPRRAPLT
ncbi:MAG TPA: hypothetical protein VGR97_02135 [Candidatus Acidoferrales bacterium]|nr:hypothetical protein [Candidatus Acidoferrales bacterium]